MTPCFDLIARLKEQKKTIATAESCTGGGIGSALTAVPGSSEVYKGGIISYTNEIKTRLLGVPQTLLQEQGAVSETVACAMAQGARKVLQTDVAISVTGLAGPGGDEYGNPVGTVFIGIADESGVKAKKFLFPGNREQVRGAAVEAAIKMALETV